MDQNTQNTQQPATSPAHPLEASPLTPVEVAPETLAHKINRVTALVLIIAGIAFVLVAILAIWQVFGDDTSDIVWRALGSLGAIALGALIVSVASKIAGDRQK